MNNQRLQVPPIENEEPIDLFEFTSAIWQAKFKIILVTATFILCAVIYILNATESWSVSATIDVPVSKQVRQYNLNRQLINDAIKTLNQDPEFSTSDQVINITTSNKNVKELPSVKELHKQFISEMRITTNQIDFFKAQPLFQSIVDEKKLDLKEENNFAYDWVTKNISFKAENIAKVNFNDKIGTKITINSIKPADALNLNQAYLIFINDMIMTRLRDTVSEELSLALQNAVIVEENKVSNNKVLLEQRINEIKQNIKIAKRANIKNFITQNISLLSTPEYAKGYEILAAEQYVLTQQLASYNISLGSSKNSLLINKWKNLNKTMELDEFDLYRFTEKPKLPKNRDKPKRVFILILATLLGFMLSITFVLLNIAIQHHKKKNRRNNDDMIK